MGIEEQATKGSEGDFRFHAAVEDLNKIWKWPQNEGHSWAGRWLPFQYVLQQNFYFLQIAHWNYSQYAL